MNAIFGFVAVGYDDGTWVDPTGAFAAYSLGCGPLVNADEIAGKIALINRGACNLSLIAYNGPVSWPVGVFIVTVDGDFFLFCQRLF